MFDAECIAQQLGRETKCCDEIVLCDVRNAAGVYCIENKSGKGSNLSVEGIYKQLQNGADIADEYLGEREKFCFKPVLATERGISETRRKKLEGKNVQLRGMHKIHVAAKNTELSALQYPK